MSRKNKRQLSTVTTRPKTTKKRNISSALLVGPLKKPKPRVLRFHINSLNMFRLSSFDKNLENATSHLRLEPDWPSILLICDAIRQNDVSAKHAFQSIKKKMMSPNPHTAYYSLLVLESVVKNCGSPMHEEISTKESCEMFSTFIEQTPHENVKQKMLELIQTWAYAFRSSEKYQAIKDTMTILKAKGHNFPELVEADAMFTADTAPDWADGKVCHRCRVEFSFTQRKHHCRNCGQIFCAQCSSKQCPLPKYGIEKEVRVCDGCYALLQKPLSGKPRSAENDLPAEYLTSSLAQQSQTPPRKSEQELKEEEELQLAIALSQSEAEEQQKKKQTQITSYRITQRSPSPDAPPAPVVNNNSLPIEETPTDPELAKYLNRSYWEQRKATESPASPSAPSPMPQINNILSNKLITEDAEIDDFANNMKSQVEIFVNRMKSNSSRGRSISNDSSVQTLFMNLTSLHSRLLTYIKEMDDKRMWYEQLQDKLAQVRDSRAALDVLRQEHIEKLKRIAEEQERQRQLQMAHKLEIMRKKKQEYLQYQRQLALQRIQEQEREMQIRQEQQKAQYMMGQTAFGFVPNQQSSPNHQIPTYGTLGYNQAAVPPQRFVPQGPLPPQTQAGISSGVPMPGMYSSGISPVPNQPNMPNIMMAGQMQNAPQQQNQPPPQGNMLPIQVPNSQQQQQQNITSQVNTIAGPPGVMPNQGQNVLTSGIPATGPIPGNFNMPSQGGPMPTNQTSNIPTIMQGNQQTIPMPGRMPPQQSQSIQSAPAAQTVINASSPAPPASSEGNNSNQQIAIINQAETSTTSKQNSEEEVKEVQTAELISFD